MKSFIRVLIILFVLFLSGVNVYSQVASVSVSVTKNVSCNGGSDGEIVVTVNGGTPPYTIRVIDINNLLFYNKVSATGVETFSGLLASDFLIRAKDESLPELWQGTFAVITQPPVLQLSASSTDITCNGDLDGKISATATGGTPGYTYTLKKGGLAVSTVSNSGSVDFTGLAAGNDYTVEVIDSKNCGPVVKGPYTIINPAALTGSVTSQTNVLCYGESTGSVTITPSGGTSPYEYSLNGGAYQSSATVGSLPAGNHTVTIRDAHFCTFDVAVTITQPASALTGSITSQTNVLCFGDNTGSVTVNKSGGVGPWQYSLDGGPYQASGTFNSLTAGSYVVTIQDNNLCTFNVPVTITEPAELLGSVTAQTNVSCFGGNNGSVTVLGSGGVGPYEYSFEGGAFQVSGTFGGLTAGSYTVTVRDANLCTEDVSVTITQPAVLGGSITGQTNVSCFGGNNGSVTVAGSGGTAPYEYKLGIAGAYQASGTFSGLTVGSYTVTVRDANLCTFDVAVNITQPTALGGSITGQTNVLCFGGNNGSVTVLGSGGTAPYEYKLGAAGAYQASGTFSGLTAGSYTVTVRDANLCTFNVAVTITQPTALSGSITAQTNVSCFGGNNGSVTVAGSGGTAPYEYKLGVAGAYQASGTFSGLTAGLYTVTVRDANLCTFDVSVTITQPAAAVSGSITAQTNVSCFGGNNGSVTVAGSGGTAPYEYKLGVAGAYQASGTFSGLTAGLYTVTVRDANLCTFDVSVTITQPAATVSGSITSQTNVSCFGGNNGSVTVAGSGGTAPYEYKLGVAGTYQASGTFSGLTAGLYTVTVRDANLCTFDVSVNITQPATAVSGSITAQTNVSCFGGNNGSVTVLGSGGTAPYEYKLGAAGAYQASGTFSGLTAGLYTVTVRDANLCTFNVAVTITQPTALSGSITAQTNVSCFGGNNGSVTVAGSGGTAPYEYKLGVAGAYQASGTFSGLTAGLYTVTVRDANLCTFDVSVTITQPAAAVSGSITAQTNVSCFGGNNGSVTVAGSGGTAPYEYKLGVAGAYQASGTFSGLTAGLYTVTVRDANLCTFDVSVTITQPAATVSGSITSQTNVSCFGGNNGSVTVAGSGGTAPYEYKLGIAGAYQASGTFSGLTAGLYTVTVRDANLCTFDVSVTITQPATAVSGSITAQTNVSCFGGNNGSVTVLGSGGTAPYEYKLGVAGAYQASGTFSGLTAGLYTVTVRDANLCTFDVAVTITQPVAIGGSITAQINVSCFGGNNGSVTVAGSGGTAPYEYKLGVAGAYQASGTFSGLTAGLYTVTVRDANLCTFDVSVTITQPTALSGSITSQTNVSCFGGNNGSVTVAGSGGTAPYEYKLGVAGAYQASGTFSGLTAGLYTITVRDANLCTYDIAVTITEPTALGGSITSQTNVSCLGGNDGSVTIAGSGGTAPYEYKLGTGAYQASGTFGGLTVGTYTVTVRDVNLCTFDVSVTITEPAAIGIALVTANPVTGCFGNTNGSILIEANGGTPNYTYTLFLGATQIGVPQTPVFPAGANFTSLAAGTYTVRVTDVNNCGPFVSGDIIINQPTAVDFTYTKQDIVCNGSLTGEIHFVPSGGTPPYEYSVDDGLTWVGTPDIFALGSGNYTLKVRDANLCESTSKDEEIIEPDQIITNGGTWKNITSCFNDNTGEINVVVLSGGVPPYQFSIDGGATWQATGLFQNLYAGSYTIIVKDVSGCTVNVGPIPITQPTQITFTYTVTNVTVCSYNTNGSIRVTGSAGGKAPRLTSIDNTNWFTIPRLFDNLGVGTHRIYVKDANGCTVTQDIVITGPPAIVIDPVTITDATCFGSADGSFNATASGGTPPLEYSINGTVYQATGNFTGLTAGTKTLYVRDANGCIKTQDVVIGQPAALYFTTQTGTNITCNGLSDGTITLVAAGGSGSYSYSITGAAPYGNVTGVFTGLPAGTYTAAVQDGTGCSTVGNDIEIVEPDPLSAVSIFTNISCFGAADGTITVTAAGGTEPRVYTLKESGVTITTNNSGIFTDLVSGIYTVEVDDANGCGPIVEGPFNIVEPTQLTFTYTKVDLTCFGVPTGQIDVDATGGTPPYEYSFDGGTNFIAGDVITGLAAGNHTVIVRDANLCTSTQVIAIDEPTELVIALTATNITCNGLTNGQIVATATGGTTTVPYQYRIDGGAWQASGTFSALAAGTYLIEVQDANGCIDGDNATIVEPTTISVDLVNSIVVNPTCSAPGSITAVGQGGTPPYTYTLGLDVNTTGIFPDLAVGSYTVSITDANGCPAYDWSVTLVGPPALDYTIVKTPDPILCFGDKTTVTINVTSGTAPYEYSIDNETTYGVNNVFTDVAAGNYQVWVRDASGCKVMKPLLITEPAELVLGTPVVTQETVPGASNGAIKIGATGGTGVLKYDLYFNGVFNTTQTPTPPDSALFSGLSSGTYYVVVTDDNGCNKRSADIVISGMSITVTVNDVICSGSSNGSILILVNGGVTPYNVQCTLLPAPGTPMTVTPTANPNEYIASGLAGGEYLITVADNLGNYRSRQVTITEPPALVATYVSHINPTCNGLTDGSVEFNITGGTEPYTITWLGGTSTGNIATNVGVGTHVFTITDANNCSVVVSNVPEIIEPSAIQISDISSLNPTCNGKPTGSISVTTTGGTGTLEYIISIGATDVDTTENGIFENLYAGIYTLRITDSNGCSAIVTQNPIELTQPLPITIAAEVYAGSLTCPYNTDGYVRNVIPSGGTPEYTYRWSTGATSSDISNLSVGTYTLYVTDANSCVDSAKYTINGPANLNLAPVVITNANCRLHDIGIYTGKIEILNSTGGNGSFDQLNFQWTNHKGVVVNSNILSNVPAGIYTVTVTDAMSCVYNIDYDVPINPLNDFVADAGKDTTVCYDNPVILIGNVNDKGNAGFNFSYEWLIDDGVSFKTVATTKDYTIQLKESRTYQFSVYESNSGCVDTSIIKVGVLPEIGLEVPLYISAVKDTIISVLMGTDFNMDVITKSYANFQWKPAELFSPSDSWNSSMLITPELKEQIKLAEPGRIVLMEDPLTKRKTEFILVDVIATSDKQCTDSIRLYTKIVDDVAIGNVFSPNGDGKNDVWRVPKNYLFPDLEIEVFNRWGSLVWSAKGDKAAKGWDGRTNSGNELPIGTYYYVLKFNVQAQSSNWKPVTGSVTIVK